MREEEKVSISSSLTKKNKNLADPSSNLSRLAGLRKSTPDASLTKSPSFSTSIFRWATWKKYWSASLTSTRSAWTSDWLVSPFPMSRKSVSVFLLLPFCRCGQNHQMLTKPWTRYAPPTIIGGERKSLVFRLFALSLLFLSAIPSLLALGRFFFTTRFSCYRPKPYLKKTSTVAAKSALSSVPRWSSAVKLQSSTIFWVWLAMEWNAT